MFRSKFLSLYNAGLHHMILSLKVERLKDKYRVISVKLPTVTTVTKKNKTVHFFLFQRRNAAVTSSSQSLQTGHQLSTCSASVHSHRERSVQVCMTDAAREHSCSGYNAVQISLWKTSRHLLTSPLTGLWRHQPRERTSLHYQCYITFKWEKLTDSSSSFIYNIRYMLW